MTKPPVGDHRIFIISREMLQPGFHHRLRQRRGPVRRIPRLPVQVRVRRIRLHPLRAQRTRARPVLFQLIRLPLHQCLRSLVQPTHWSRTVDSRKGVIPGRKTLPVAMKLLMHPIHIREAIALTSVAITIVRIASIKISPSRRTHPISLSVTGGMVIRTILLSNVEISLLSKCWIATVKLSARYRAPVTPMPPEVGSR